MQNDLNEAGHNLNSAQSFGWGMENYAVADQLDMLAKLMDIHGENSFKAKS